ncbi:MAG TPA: tryptophan synthase subunit alpha [Vicinamibacterales bacterium]|nr:tryptophan synthase subunit alpha [Vicinamibacterales bacterium]
MTRLDAAFARLKATTDAGLVTYITAGDPDLERTAGLLRALPGAGADVLEVGVPFSDPLADGPVIQRASERALRAGTTLRKVIAMIARERDRIDAPVVIFTYANPIERLGYDTFVAAAADAGVDGVLVLDLPIDEAGPLARKLEERGLAPIFLVSPTTPPERVRRAAKIGSGFLYAISRLGVTGARDALSSDAAGVVATIRRVSELPVALGFGISRPEHVRAACAIADAAVVGSAIVNVIAESGDDEDPVARVCRHVRWLKGVA